MFQYCPRFSALTASLTMRALFSPESLLPSTIFSLSTGQMRYVRSSSKPAYADSSKRNCAALFVKAFSLLVSASPFFDFTTAMLGLFAGMSRPSSYFHNCASSEPLFSPTSTRLPFTRNALFVTGLMMRQLPASSETFQYCAALSFSKSVRPTILSFIS